MPQAAMSGGPCSARFYDYPRPGSIYTMPDDLRLVRGPTIVRLFSGRDVKVPANLKQMAHAPSQVHDAHDNEDVLKQLQALLSGRKAPEGPQRQQGFEMPQGPGYALGGREQNQLREAGIAGGGVHGHF
jgi:hypothetical protein